MKNSIKISVITLAFASFFSLNSKAQETDGPKPVKSSDESGIRLSVGPDFVVPIGDLKNRYKWGVGGSIQADLPVVKDQLFVTLNAGYLDLLKSNDYTGSYRSDLSLIPVKAGLKYFPVKNFYLQGEAGASFLANKDDIGGTKSTSFVYAPQLGYQFSIGNNSFIDAGVRFESNTKFTENGKNNNFFGLRLAYSFGL